MPDHNQDEKLSAAADVLAVFQSGRDKCTARRLRSLTGFALILGFYALSWRLAEVDLAKLATGLPKILAWLSLAWPLKFEDPPLILMRTMQTVAMAAIGTTVATILAIPLAVLASLNITPFPALYHPARGFLNMLRGIDSFFLRCCQSRPWGLGLLRA